MKIAKLTIVATLTLAAAAAQADTFNYSYSFGNGSTVTGSFNGTASGNLVTDLTNVTASLNGTAFVGSGSLHASSWDWTDVNGWVNGGAVASFNGQKNNFMFMDIDATNDCCTAYYKNYFSAIIGPNIPYVTQSYSRVTGEIGWDYQNADEQYLSSHWTLTNVSAVPEPESFALLLAGLGLMGAAVRRRAAKQA